MEAPKMYDGAQLVFYERMLQAFREILNLTSWNFEKGRVLDYGCGPGTTAYNFVLPLVEATDSNLYSVDISPSMVEYAKAHFSHPRIHYATGSLPDNFPFKLLKFDKVLSVNVFQFIPDIRNVLRGIRDSLKTGGELGFMCASPNTCPVKIWEELAKTEKWSEYMKNYKRFWPEWALYRSIEPLSYFRTVLLNDTGFEEVNLKFIKYSVNTNDVDAAIEMSVAINPCLGDIPEHLHPELKEDYKKIYQESCGVIIDENMFSTDSFELLYGVIRKKGME